MQLLVNTCMATLSEGSDAFDDLVSPFCDPCHPVYTASHLSSFDNEQKGKKSWNWATTSPCWRLHTGGTLLQKPYKCERGRRTWLLTPLCVKLRKDFHDLGKTDKTWNRIRFCSALYQVCIYFILFYCWFIIYLFIFLSIYFFSFAFYEQRFR